MKPYKKTFTFTNIDTSNLEGRIKNYFTYYNFKFKQINENEFLIKRKSTYLDGWKRSPLTLTTDIKIIAENSTLKIDYEAYGLTISPYIFSEFFDEFIRNFEDYLKYGKEFKLANETIVNTAKTRVIYYGLIYIAVMSLGVVLSYYLKTFFGNKYVGILVLAAIFSFLPKFINNYLKEKHEKKLQNSTHS